MTIRNLKDIDVSNKKVLVRTGFDLPLDKQGNILDDKRLKSSVESIQYLLDNNTQQIILTWHMGRPQGEIVPTLMNDEVAERFSKLINLPIKKIDDWGEKGLPNDKIIALENLRFHPGEKSDDKNKRDSFGKHLAELADIYVNDAFSNCHRDHASMTSVPKYIPSAIGFSVEKELKTWQSVMDDPQRPVICIFGGVKADKIDAMGNIVKFADYVLVGGALAYSMLKCTGINVGSSKVDQEGLDKCNAEIKALVDDPKTILPTDCVIANKFDENAETRIVDIHNIGDWMALDIGPETIKTYQDYIEKAETILWFGPIGVFEFDKFANGTREIAQEVAKTNGVKIIGGGNSADAIDDLGFADKMTLVSTGGGASLELVQGNALPAIEAIKTSQM